jgi:DNA-binding transcriptional MerR regulator
MHDLKVFNYIATARSSGDSHEKVKEALARMQADGYTDLPDIPDHWTIPPQDGRIALSDATGYAQEVAQLAALQVQVQTLRERLEESQERAETLQRELDHLRATHGVAESQLHGVELDLERAKADIARLEGEMRQYTFGVAEKPINVGLIILVAVSITVVIVLAIVFLSRLM